MGQPYFPRRTNRNNLISFAPPRVPRGPARLYNAQAALHIGGTINQAAQRPSSYYNALVESTIGATIMPLSRRPNKRTTPRGSSGVRGRRRVCRLAILKMIIARMIRARVNFAWREQRRCHREEERGPGRRKRNAKAPAGCGSALILSNARELVISRTPQSSVLPVNSTFGASPCASQGYGRALTNIRRADIATSVIIRMRRGIC